MSQPAAPIELYEATVQPEWLDYNGHMNVAYYLHIFDKSLDVFLEDMGIGISHTRAGVGSAFALESHITYQRELFEGDRVRVDFQLLDADGKRLHFFMRMWNTANDVLSATHEALGIYVDMRTRKSARFPDKTYARLQDILAAHRTLARPPEAGRIIGIRRRQT